MTSMETMPDQFQIVPVNVQSKEEEAYLVELADNNDSLVMFYEELPNDDSATSGWRIEETVEAEEAEPPGTNDAVGITVSQMAKEFAENKAFVDHQLSNITKTLEFILKKLC